jgi:hypothetical protein
MQTRIPVVQGRVGSSLFVARLTKQGEPDFLLDPPSLETLDIGACGQYVQPKSNSSKLDPTKTSRLSGKVRFFTGFRTYSRELKLKPAGPNDQTSRSAGLLLPVSAGTGPGSPYRE